MSKTKVGVIGCGNISGIYLKRMQELAPLQVAGCADMVMDKATAKAAEHKVPALTVEQLLADPTIEIVVNLTVPKAHYAVAMQALKAGKSVYDEKPLAAKREEGKELVTLAKQKKLLVGGAPDTFLGGGIQTCRKLIDDGWIGQPIGATAFMTCRGHESWHPDPEFYYEVGGGPLFDMGPYYLTALVFLMGPVRRVTGSARASFTERTITSKPKFGKKVKVETPTHIAGVLDFGSGAIGTILTSFDVWAAELPRIEIYGSEGSLSVPDPNGFGGPVRIRRPGDKDWREMPLTHGYQENSRGLGVADMARALQTGRKPRASGDLCFHVLDIMHAVHEASAQGAHVILTSTCDQPAPLPLGLMDGQLD
jgi:predicted dehydrogenase